jgi:ABC-type hemin transport system ATPase subunit
VLDFQGSISAGPRRSGLIVLAAVLLQRRQFARVDGSDEMACLHLGRVIARGQAKDVLKDPGVVASYLGTDEAAVFRSGRAPRRRATKVGVS